MSRPTQPITTALYGDLLAIHKKLKKMAPGTERPFVPCVGSRYGDQRNPRVMFIGMATRGWSGAPHLDAADELASNTHYLNSLAEERRSVFISFAVRMMREVWLATGRSDGPYGREWALERIVWSNLAKIAVDEDYPKGRHADVQRNLNQRLLQYELDALRPTVVFITTGSYEDGENDLVHSVFGPNEHWDKILPGRQHIQGRVWYNKRHAPERLIFWTPHPRHWHHREEEISGILSVFRQFSIRSNIKR